MSTSKKAKIKIGDKEQHVIDQLKIALSKSHKAIEEFRESLREDSAEAFSWGGGAITAAAQICIYEQIVSSLEKGNSLSNVLQHANREALNVARFPPRSTSPISNLLDIEKGAAWAYFVKYYGELRQ